MMACWCRHANLLGTWIESDVRVSPRFIDICIDLLDVLIMRNANAFDENAILMLPLRQRCCSAVQDNLSRSVVRSTQRALSPAHINKKRHLATLLVVSCTRFPTRSNLSLLVPTTTALYATKNVAIWRFLLT